MEDYLDGHHNSKIKYHLNLWKIYLFFILTHINQYSNASNLRLIESNLKTFQSHACDGQQLSLNCFDNTVIQITHARYGNQSIQSCNSPAYDNLSLIKNNQNTTKNKFNYFDVHNKDSLLNCTESLKYSLLQKVEAACREQTSCQIKTSPETLGIKDVCPSVVKYAEVAFKCRPNVFSNKEACADEQLDFTCPKSKRLLIYSAFLGTSNQTPMKCMLNMSKNQNYNFSSNSSHLSSSANISSFSSSSSFFSSSSTNKPFTIENCQLNSIKEIIDSKCYAQKQCSLSTNLDDFGWPDCAKSIPTEIFKKNLYLKVSFACVPKNVLKNVPVISEHVASSNHNKPILSKKLNNSVGDFGFVVERKKTHDQKDAITRLKESLNSNSSLKKVKNDLNQNSSAQNSIPSVTEDYNGFIESPSYNYIQPVRGTTSKTSSKIPLSTVSDQVNKEDNLAAAVLSNQNTMNPSNNELTANYRTHISSIKNGQNFLSNWEPTYNYIQHNLERLFIYVLIALCIALLFCFVFLGITHLMDKKHQNKQPQCENIDFLDQNDCCDSKIDVSSNDYKSSHLSNVFSGFEEDNPTVDEIINELHRNSSFIGISQQMNHLNNQLNAQLINKQETGKNNLSSHKHMILTNSNLPNPSINNGHNLHNQVQQQPIQFINSNHLASSFFQNKENNNLNANYAYSDNCDQYGMIYKENTLSPQKIATLPHPTTIYGIHTYSPVFYQATNSNGLIDNQQQTCISPQNQQLIISNSNSNQLDNETISNATTTTTLCSSQGDNSLNRPHLNEMQISATTASGLMHNSSSFQPITLQIVSTQPNLNSVNTTDDHSIQQQLQFNSPNSNHQIISNDQIDDQLHLTRLNIENQPDNTNFQVYFSEQQPKLEQNQYQTQQQNQHQVETNFNLNPTSQSHCSTLLANAVTNGMNTVSSNLKHNQQQTTTNHSNLTASQLIEVLNCSNASNSSSNKVNSHLLLNQQTLSSTFDTHCDTTM